MLHKLITLKLVVSIMILKKLFSNLKFQWKKRVPSLVKMLSFLCLDVFLNRLLVQLIWFRGTVINCKMRLEIFWVVTACSLVGGYHCFLRKLLPQSSVWKNVLIINGGLEHNDLSKRSHPTEDERRFLNRYFKISRRHSFCVFPRLLKLWNILSPKLPLSS